MKPIFAEVTNIDQEEIVKAVADMIRDWYINLDYSHIGYSSEEECRENMDNDYWHEDIPIEIARICLENSYNDYSTYTPNEVVYYLAWLYAWNQKLTK
jgi:hypothetical protein